MRRQTMKWVIFAVTSLGNFISMLDFSAVNIALYKISSAFALPVSAVQWVMLSYQIILTSLLIFFGRLGDMVNRRKLYTIGFLTFGSGAALSYFSINFIMLLTARVIQGAGGSILIANSFSIVSSTFKGKQRGKALGFMGAITHLAGMTAPSISGFLIGAFSWRSIFLPSCFLSFMAVFLAAKIIPAKRILEKRPIDVWGTILLTASIAAVLFIIAEIPTKGLWAAQSGIIGAATLICLLLFVRHENRTPAPLVSFKLFVSPVFLFSNLALMVSYLAMYPNTILFPFYSQGVLENSAFLTGLLILPFSLFYLMTAVLTGTLSPQKRMFAGMLLLGTGLFLFSRTTETTPLFLLVLMQIVMGVGNAFFQPSVNTAILNAAPKDSTGMASGILSLFRNTGIAMGSVVSVGIFEMRRHFLSAQGIETEKALLLSYHFALICGIGFAFLCLMFIIKSIRSSQKGAVS
ncbi:MAG: MFS transporter [Alphaproteobacteria bacterium]|nr:MFS transporter [Alphaproteobacteria bacterium]